MAKVERDAERLLAGVPNPHLSPKGEGVFAASDGAASSYVPRATVASGRSAGRGSSGTMSNVPPAVLSFRRPSA